MIWNFEYGLASVRNFQVHGDRDLKTNRTAVKHVEVNGRAAVPTGRFWKSLFMRFGFSDSVFRYFDHAEVFERISQRNPDDKVRYCIATDERGENRLLAVSSSRRPLIQFGEVNGLLERFGGRDATYHDGIMTSTHTPRG